ncbi:hypothetical protein WQO_00215 [Streptomyces globisporus C-1027]|uniref:Uncharacterized protein n=1 Tax=Streptomyces globisporus C-1027 TaxID=1172567 RepID=A0A0U3L613_STRGL|nr:hypothetical protein WQO_00215 [Streptomyces globisporus C-1027]
MGRVIARGSAEDWDIVVALTDLPLHPHRRKLVVDLNHEHGVALLSLPSLGGWRKATTKRPTMNGTVPAAHSGAAISDS